MLYLGGDKAVGMLPEGSVTENGVIKGKGIGFKYLGYASIKSTAPVTARMCRRSAMLYPPRVWGGPGACSGPRPAFAADSRAVAEKMPRVMRASDAWARAS